MGINAGPDILLFASLSGKGYQKQYYSEKWLATL